MESEKIAIVDEERRPLGVKTRGEAHRLGHWHETFHCWLVEKKKGKTLLYFQLRSMEKKEFPGLLDITAAGHILANESIEDGVREVREELGLDVRLGDLIQAGVIKTSIVEGELIDNEFNHVYFYEWEGSIDDFHLQEEEVSGMVRVDAADFQKLLYGELDVVLAEGFVLNSAGERKPLKRNVGKNDFTPSPDVYYEQILQWVGEIFQ